MHEDSDVKLVSTSILFWSVVQDNIQEGHCTLHSWCKEKIWAYTQFGLIHPFPLCQVKGDIKFKHLYSQGYFDNPELGWSMSMSSRGHCTFWLQKKSDDNPQNLWLLPNLLLMYGQFLIYAKLSSIYGGSIVNKWDAEWLSLAVFTVKGKC